MTLKYLNLGYILIITAIIKYFNNTVYVAFDINKSESL